MSATSWFRQVLVVALKELSDRYRSGWVIVCAVVWLGAIACTSVFGLIQVGRIGVLGYERTAISLLNLTQYLVPLLGLLIGHDLLVREREDRTLNLVLAAGVPRGRVLWGKFIGGTFTLGVPLVLGFLIAGVAIGLAAGDKAFGPFARLGISGLMLGIVFCAVGLLISTVSRSRIQALVCALLSWGFAVFAFDLIALGTIISSNAVEALAEIDLICDATHVNSQADLHAAYDRVEAVPEISPSAPSDSGTWLWVNPVDAFRLVNLPAILPLQQSIPAALISALGWMTVALSFSLWRLRKIDL